MHAKYGASNSQTTTAGAKAILELYRAHEGPSKEMREYRIADFPLENPQSDIHVLESTVNTADTSGQSNRNCESRDLIEPPEPLAEYWTRIQVPNHFAIDSLKEIHFCNPSISIFRTIDLQEIASQVHCH